LQQPVKKGTCHFNTPFRRLCH